MNKYHSTDGRDQIIPGGIKNCIAWLCVQRKDYMHFPLDQKENYQKLFPNMKFVVINNGSYDLSLSLFAPGSYKDLTSGYKEETSKADFLTYFFFIYFHLQLYFIYSRYFIHFLRIFILCDCLGNNQLKQGFYLFIGKSRAVSFRGKKCVSIRITPFRYSERVCRFNSNRAVIQFR